MSTLPKELIVEILSRLPVKSLCQFKCVSKKWKFLISHSLFAKLQFSQSQALERTRLLADGKTDLFSADLEPVSGTEDYIPLKGLQFPGRLPKDTRRLLCIGHSNGLLGIIREDLTMLVYNPSIGLFKEIQDPHQSSDQSGVFGFGYAESIDDYKLVKIADPGNIVRVYSLRDDRSWKDIPNDLLFRPEYFNMGIALNGAIHWALENLEDSCVIVPFDLVEEKFKTLPPPDKVLKDNHRFSLGVLGGYLCLAVKKPDSDSDSDSDEDRGCDCGSDCQFWVMMEYGVKESWTRILVPRPFYQLKPLCFLNTSETLLLMMDLELVFWDLNSEMLKNIDARIYRDEKDGRRPYEDVSFGLDYWGESDALVYVESLFSPNYDPDFTMGDSSFKDWF